jgi:hypothetical protein
MGFSTAAYIAMAAAAAGTVVSTASAVQQGKSAQNLANYNAQIAQNDAIAARQKAEFDASGAGTSGKVVRGQSAGLYGLHRRRIAGHGRCRDMSAEEAELENLAIRYGGEMGYRAGQQRATVARFEGAVAKQSRRRSCKLASDRRVFGVVVWQDTNITEDSA